MEQVASSGNVKCALRILNGKLDHKLFPFKKLPIKIGRDKDNHIVISGDNNCSRKHAIISEHNGNLMITNLSSRNPLIVNKNVVKTCYLKSGDIIYVGRTKIQIAQTNLGLSPVSIAKNSNNSNNFNKNFGNQNNVISNQMPNNANMVFPNKFNQNLNNRVSNPNKEYNFNPSSKKFSSNNRSNVTYYLIAIIILAGFYFYSEKNKEKMKRDFSLRTATDIANEQKESAERIEKFQEKNNYRFSPLQEKAQSFFIKGRRDYSLGQYVRALDSFKAALMINPDHQLAGRYFKLALHKRDEMIQLNMIQGKRYMKSNHYRRCQSAFENIFSILKGDKQDIRYQEAKQLHNECSVLLKGRY